MLRFAYNAGSVPVVIDDRGRTLGGAEFGTVDDHERGIADLVKDGVLVYVQPPEKDADGAAVSAFATHTARVARAAKKKDGE